MDTTSPVADVVVGIHPEHGVCATNPGQHHVAAYYLDRLAFEPVPSHPFLHRLVAPEAEVENRARSAVSVMRRAGLAVEADHNLEPAFAPHPGASPAVAIAEVPGIGIAAATEAAPGQDNSAGHTLVDLGWRYRPDLDIHVLPPADRTTALAAVARTVLELQAQDRIVALHPALAAEARRPRKAHDQGAVRRTAATPLRTSTALAASPARVALPGRPPVPSTARPTPAAASSEQTKPTQTR
jgi:hypothetical protein